MYLLLLDSKPQKFYLYKKKTYLDTAKAVIDAGSVLSFRSYAVCMVNLLRKTNCLCHLNPTNKKTKHNRQDKTLKPTKLTNCKTKEFSEKQQTIS